MQRQIGLEEMNQLVLCKQHLAGASRAESKDLVQIVKDICGLHAQVASTPYLSLWNRMRGFQKEELSQELYEKRTLVKIWGMRGTLHILPTDHLVEYYQATKRAGGRHPFNMKPIHERILRVVDKQGPLTAQELTAWLPELKNKIESKYPGIDTIGQLSLREMSQSTVLVPSKPSGDWKSNLHTYVSLRTWLPSVNLEALNEQEARKKVVFHYLAGFGPAIAEDIAWWIGLGKGDVKEILEEMNDEIDSINIRGSESTFFILKSDLEGMFVREDSVHLLPKFDPYVMGYKNRQRLIATEYENRVYWSTRAEVSPSIVVNGRIIGTWSHKEEKNKITITLSPFEKTNRRLANAIKQQAEDLARFIGEKASEVIL
jgi:hypothetical protein